MEGECGDSKYGSSLKGSSEVGSTDRRVQNMDCPSQILCHIHNTIWEVDIQDHPK